MNRKEVRTQFLGNPICPKLVYLSLQLLGSLQFLMRISKANKSL